MTQRIGITCPKCSKSDVSVVDSRKRPGARYRRYLCVDCAERFNTYELTEYRLVDLGYQPPKDPKANARRKRSAPSAVN